MFKKLNGNVRLGLGTGGIEGRSEAASARPLAAGGIKGRSEAATARPLAASGIKGKSEAATARPLAAGGSEERSTTATTISSVVSEGTSVARQPNRADLTLQLEIMECATTYFLKGANPPMGTLQTTIAEAVEAASTNYGVAEAVDWTDGFEFPQIVLDSDLRCFRAAQLDFETMVRRRLKTIKASRLNLSRINMLLVDNPERNLLLDLAEGMRVPRPESQMVNLSYLHYDHPTSRSREHLIK